MTGPSARQNGLAHQPSLKTGRARILSPLLKMGRVVFRAGRPCPATPMRVELKIVRIRLSNIQNLMIKKEDEAKHEGGPSQLEKQ